ncbi:hypothetical protein RCS94_06350 [Orbaceae bacterium ac157xtp]
MVEVNTQNDNNTLEFITKICFFLSAEEYLIISEKNSKSFIKRFRHKYRYLRYILVGWFILGMIVQIISRIYLYVTEERYIPSEYIDLYGFFSLGVIFGVFFGLFRISFAIGNRRGKNEKLKNSKMVNKNTPFEYFFYKEGVIVNEPFQQVNLNWYDIAQISLFKETFLMALCPSDMKGYEWTKNITPICIPAKEIEKEKELMEFVKQLPQFKDFQKLGF